MGLALFDPVENLESLRIGHALSVEQIAAELAIPIARWRELANGHAQPTPIEIAGLRRITGYSTVEVRRVLNATKRGIELPKPKRDGSIDLISPVDVV